MTAGDRRGKGERGKREYRKEGGGDEEGGWIVGKRRACRFYWNIKRVASDRAIDSPSCFEWQELRVQLPKLAQQQPLREQSREQGDGGFEGLKKFRVVGYLLSAYAFASNRKGTVHRR